MNLSKVAPWEVLQKQMLWDQLSCIHNQKVLDFGSGLGMTASHFALDNEVVAIEPDNRMLTNRYQENAYVQIQGDIKALQEFKDESFNVILCHNVFEYASEREALTKEFSRLLNKNGILSVVKHNRAGRVMQMVVLLNNFEHARELLQGKCGATKDFGSINYYENIDLLKWSPDLTIERIFGIRTFWDLQQNQEIQKNEEWQRQMLAMEHSVSEIEEYKAIAFFHHLILRKK